MPERKKTPAKKRAAKSAPATKAAAKSAPTRNTATKRAAPVHKAVAPPPAAGSTTPASTVTEPGTEVCPRCGTEKFAPEERMRVDGRRTVRYTVLVCERGHTFARPARRD